MDSIRSQCHQVVSSFKNDDLSQSDSDLIFFAPSHLGLQLTDKDEHKRGPVCTKSYTSNSGTLVKTKQSYSKQVSTSSSQTTIHSFSLKINETGSLTSPIVPILETNKSIGDSSCNQQHQHNRSNNDVSNSLNSSIVTNTNCNQSSINAKTVSKLASKDEYTLK